MWSRGGGLFWRRLGVDGAWLWLRTLSTRWVVLEGSESGQAPRTTGRAQGRRPGHGLQLGHLLVTTAERVWSTA